VVTFIFAFQMTFPFDRIKDKIVEALADKYDVTIGGVERGLIPGRVYFDAITLRTRPTKASDIATTFHIDQLEVDLGLLALVRSTIAVKLDALIKPGHIKGRVAIASGGTSIHIAGDDLPSGSLPVREALGLPMSGTVRFSFDLELPNERAKPGGKAGPNWGKAEGRAEFACPSRCTVGDGKSKLMLTTNNARQQAFLDEGGGGIDFGKVNIESLLADVEIKNGRLEITRFETRSGDGDLHIAFSMQLNQDLPSSQVAGCLRFRGSDALLKREPKTHAAFSTTGAPVGPDNLFHIKLDGPLRQVRRIGVVCSSTSGPDSAGPPPRPNLSISPEPAARPPGLGSVSMPPPPQPSIAQPPAAPPAAPAQTGSSEVPHAPGAVGEGPPPVVYPSTGSAVAPGAPPAPSGPSGPPAGAAANPPPPPAGSPQ
jgi:type II secretion system protein N